MRAGRLKTELERQSAAFDAGEFDSSAVETAGLDAASWVADALIASRFERRLSTPGAQSWVCYGTGSGHDLGGPPRLNFALQLGRGAAPRAWYEFLAMFRSVLPITPCPERPLDERDRLSLTVLPTEAEDEVLPTEEELELDDEELDDDDVDISVLGELETEFSRRRWNTVVITTMRCFDLAPQPSTPPLRGGDDDV